MEMKDYRRLRENGVLLQLNLLSLAGMYGSDARKRALQLLKDGMYDRTGTDLHRLRPFAAAISDKCLTGKQLSVIPKFVE